MGKIFNIAGPCNPEDHYMLPAMSRLPDVMRLIEDKSYFVVHAQRQCGKTTAFRALVDDINAKGDRVALYCTLEDVQVFSDPVMGLPRIADQIRQAVSVFPERFGNVSTGELKDAVATSEDTAVVKNTLREISRHAGKPLVVFFDEVDCLSEGTLVAFLRQLRSGRIGYTQPQMFPVSIALIGMRNIRDFKAKIRPGSETLGSASPFNVITKAMTLRLFTQDEVKVLYQQHTDATGQIFEDGVVERAFEYSQGQPYLVNALARWCMDEIHDRRYAEPITLDDMHEAKEKIIRERPVNLNSIWKRINVDWMRRAIGFVGKVISESDVDESAVTLAECHGALSIVDGRIKYSCPIVEQMIVRFLSGDLRYVA